MKNNVSTTQILEDLEKIYTLALEKENLSVALKATELLGREYGLFWPSSYRKKISLRELSDDDLSLLIRKLESYGRTTKPPPLYPDETTFV